MVQPQYESAHRRLHKYQLMGIGGYWKARVPYGTWRIFGTWEEGRAWLTEKHGVRVHRRSQRESVSETESTPNERQGTL